MVAGDGASVSDPRDAFDNPQSFGFNPARRLCRSRGKYRICFEGAEAGAMSRYASVLALALATALSGCASVTTKITGSPRAGTEQLLLTGTSDQAVGLVDFRPLAGHRVFLDTSGLS